MRTIDVTNGGKEYVTATVTETGGLDLTAATFTVALTTGTDTPETWQTPDDSTVTGATAVVSLLVDDVAQIGVRQALWVKVVDGPEVLIRRCTNDLVTVV